MIVDFDDQDAVFRLDPQLHITECPQTALRTSGRLQLPAVKRLSTSPAVSDGSFRPRRGF